MFKFSSHTHLTALIDVKAIFSTQALKLVSSCGVSAQSAGGAAIFSPFFIRRGVVPAAPAVNMHGVASPPTCGWWKGLVGLQCCAGRFCMFVFYVNACVCMLCVHTTEACAVNRGSF